MPHIKKTIILRIPELQDIQKHLSEAEEVVIPLNSLSNIFQALNIREAQYEQNIQWCWAIDGTEQAVIFYH